MKAVLITSLFTSLFCNSAEKQESNPWSSEGGYTPKDIIVTTETIELDAATAFAQLRLFQDTHQLRLQLQKLILDGKASVKDTSTVRGRSGERMSSRCSYSHIHPTEYEPSSWPIPPEIKAHREKREQLRKALFHSRPNKLTTAFEERPIGLSYEVEPTIDDNETVNLSLSHHWYRLGPPSFYDHGADEFGFQSLYLPTNVRERTQTGVILAPNTYQLIAAKPAVSDDGNLNNNRLILTFAKADVLEIK